MGIRAQRPCEGDAARRVVVHEFRSDDALRCNALLDPLLERLHDVVIGVGQRCPLAEVIGAGTTAAVQHPGDHEEAVEILRPAEPHLVLALAVALARPLRRRDAFVIVDAVARPDCRIVPAVIVDQLAATLLERAEIGIGGVEHRGQRLAVHELAVREGDVTVEVQGEDVEARVVEDHEAEEIHRELIQQRAADAHEGGTRFPQGKRRGRGFGARLVARMYERAGARTVRAGVDLLQRGDLRPSQASGGLDAGALQDRRVEGAVARVGDDAILDVVLDEIADSERRRLDRRKLGGPNVAPRCEQSLLRPRRVEQEMRPEVRRRPRDDAVEIIREALCLHQGLAAAVGAAEEIGVRGTGRRQRREDRLRVVRRLLERAVAEVDDLFGMSERPGRVRAAGDVTVVCAGGRIAAPERVAERAIRDGSGEAAVADLEVLAVPRGACGDPHLEADVRVGGRVSGADHATEGWKPGQRRADRRSKGSGRLGLSEGDRGVWQ